jgi:outer membrane biosynthesis protein TonB
VTSYRFFQFTSTLALTVWLSLAVHVVGAALVFLLARGTAEAGPPPDETIELVLVPEEPEPPPEDPAAAEDAPTAYTDIPDRLADERPDRADFLALRDSRAADRLPGGQAGDQPGTEREGEFPQVTIAPENLAGGEGVTVEEPVIAPQPSASERQPRPQPQTPAGSEASELGDPPVQPPRPRDEPQDEVDTPAEPVERPAAGDYDDWLAEQRAPSLTRPGERQAPGDRGFDFRQLEQGSIGANVDLEGDFTLNTYEWNFAPWMHRFASDLRRAWIAPYAYRLGIINGYTRIRLVVEPDGRPSSMEILAEEGHESLHQASKAALQAFAPYAPLPRDFPEDRLVILLGLHYPQWKR